MEEAISPRGTIPEDVQRRDMRDARPVAFTAMAAWLRKHGKVRACWDICHLFYLAVSGRAKYYREQYAQISVQKEDASARTMSIFSITPPRGSPMSTLVMIDPVFTTSSTSCCCSS